MHVIRDLGPRDVYYNNVQDWNTINYIQNSELFHIHHEISYSDLKTYAATFKYLTEDMSENDIQLNAFRHKLDETLFAPGTEFLILWNDADCKWKETCRVCKAD